MLNFTAIRRFSTRLTFKGLPFKLYPHEAKNIVVSGTKLLEGSEHLDSGTLKQVYVPFHTASVSNLTSSFTCSYGIDRTETYIAWEYNQSTKSMRPVTRTRTVTDWYRASGDLGDYTYPVGTIRTQVYAGFTLPRKYTKILKMDDVSNLKSLTTDDLHNSKNARIRVEPHEMTISMALEKIIEKLYSMEKDRVGKVVRKQYGADHVDVKTLDVHLDKCRIDPHSYHLPAYVYEFEQDDTKLCKIVNGYNGEIDGDVIYSKPKVLGVAGLTGVTGTTIFLLAARTLTIPLFAVGSIVSSLLIGIPALWWSMSRPHRVAETNAAKLQNDLEHNIQFQQTLDDIIRKTMANKFNAKDSDWDKPDKNTDQHSQSDRSGSQNSSQKKSPKHDYSGISDYEVLGLDSRTDLTQQILKEAYIKQIKIWHPDHYANDTAKATAMSARITEAYNNLKTRI
jgi:hypothetical protein